MKLADCVLIEDPEYVLTWEDMSVHANNVFVFPVGVWDVGKKVSDLAPLLFATPKRVVAVRELLSACNRLKAELIAEHGSKACAANFGYFFSALKNVEDKS